tara:strand:+ start:4603 stop:5010 length:408 start_codon:yes stop_codon:yes gene_type:complete
MSTTTTISNDVQRILDKTETVIAAKTLSHADSGKVFILTAAAGAAITLPALKAGANFKFIVGSAFATTSWTVTGGGAKIQGTVIVNGASVLGENETTITFADAAEKIGDFAELHCDGTNWYLSGVGSAASSITLA